MFSDSFDKALAFAHNLHRKQKRKVSGAPYISHLLGVSALVIEAGGSEIEAIAALLHDSLEDQWYNFPGGLEPLRFEIGRMFGQDVLRIVDACTEERGGKKKPGADPRAEWRGHKLAYLEQIRSSESAVQRVSCADSLHNVRSLILDQRRMGEGVWQRFKTRNAEDHLWFYDLAAKAFLESGVGPLAVELDREVQELHQQCGVERTRRSD